MHRLAIKFGGTLLGILAFIGVDLELASPLSATLNNAAAGQVGAFIIGAVPAFAIFLAADHYGTLIKR